MSNPEFMRAWQTLMEADRECWRNIHDLALHYTLQSPVGPAMAALTRVMCAFARKLEDRLPLLRRHAADADELERHVATLAERYSMRLSDIECFFDMAVEAPSFREVVAQSQGGSREPTMSERRRTSTLDSSRSSGGFEGGREGISRKPPLQAAATWGELGIEQAAEDPVTAFFIDELRLGLARERESRTRLTEGKT